MATIKLTPSTYYLSNSNYLSVSNAANMYDDCDSTTYATVTNSRTSTTSYYIYVRGFNLSQVPSDAIVSDVAVRIKARHQGGYAQAMYLYDGTSTSLGSSSTTLSTTATTHTINVTHSWADLVNAGSDLGIRINCRRSSRNTTAYVYVYGAEIEVTYTVPVYHSVTVSNSTSATVTVSDSNPLEGTDVEVRASTVTGITIKDNGVDVTGQFTQRTETPYTIEFENRGTYGFALNGSNYYQSANKGVDKSCSVCRVNLDLAAAATVTFQYINYAEASYDFGVFGNIDVALTTNYYPAGSSGATISETSYRKACNTSADNTSSVQTLTYSVSAGEHFIDVKYSKDDGSAANNDTLQFKVTVTMDGGYTPATYYGYDISNVQADHTVLVTTSGGGPTLYVKLNGSWVQVSRAYVKQGGTWVQTTLDSAFNAGTNYVRGN